MAKRIDSPGGTKNKIFHAAAKLFALQGYAATSVREIAKEADVNLALINYHFRDKSQLLQAVLEYGLQLWNEILISQEGKDLEEMLVFLMRQMTNLEGAAYYVNIFLRLYLDSAMESELKLDIVRRGTPKIEVLQRAVAKKMQRDEIDCDVVLIAHYLMNNLILSSRIQFGIDKINLQEAYFADCFAEPGDPYLQQLLSLAKRLVGS